MTVKRRDTQWIAEKTPAKTHFVCKSLLVRFHEASSAPVAVRASADRPAHFEFSVLFELVSAGRISPSIVGMSSETVG